ncbi:MAG: response regulator [Leptolyngbyaceae bacterium]|nr:response regulator [Leptolyngbyaceae bacterium]
MTKAAILCVDDESTILKVLKEQLKRCFGKSYIYETAQSAEEAWEIIDDLCEDEVQLLLIVSDWLMPGVKGDEFLVQVHQRFPKIVNVMLTGQADESAIERARQQANLHACLYKPWKEEDLHELLSTALDAGFN